MYKNQLQELAQRSCFNLPSYTCIREGPDHAPRFKATVNFNGETFETPQYCTTLRQAEHAAAEVALNSISNRGPSNSLAARILDETGVYKNLLQEISQRVGASLPIYTTSRAGLGHLPVFTCTVELAGITFTGGPAKNKKQAEKNAAMAAWSSLKRLVQVSESSSLEMTNCDEQEHITIARALQKFRLKAKMANLPFPVKFPLQSTRPSGIQPPRVTSSKLLPLIHPKQAPPRLQFPESQTIRNAIGAAPYIPVRHFRANHGIAPPVTVRNAIPVFSAPPLPPPGQMMRPPCLSVAPPVCIRQAVPVFSAPPARLEPQVVSNAPAIPPASASFRIEENGIAGEKKLESGVIQDMKELKM